MPQFNHILYENPGLKYPSVTDCRDFAEYISQCQNLIRGARADLLNNANAEAIVNANSPYEINPQGKLGALVLHGLYDSPFVVRDIANFLAGEGLRVRSILLPGHGTVPGALLSVRFQEWLAATEAGVQSLMKVCEKFIIVGFSTGASSALQQILEKKYSAAGLVLLAPAIKISSLSKITWAPPKLSFDWFHRGNENDYVRYHSYTFNSIYQVYLLSQLVEKLSLNVEKIPCPMLVAISKDDRTVDSSAALAYFQRYADTKSRMILYTNQNKNLDDDRIMQRSATVEKWQIKNISHVSVPIAPENPHYGINGDYIEASHVTSGSKIIYVNEDETVYSFLNWLHQLGIGEHRYQRLSFNPDFDFLKEQILQFASRVLPK